MSCPKILDIPISNSTLVDVPEGHFLIAINQKGRIIGKVLAFKEKNPAGLTASILYVMRRLIWWIFATDEGLLKNSWADKWMHKVTTLAASAALDDIQSRINSESSLKL